jgi:hypothetical protein
VWGSLAGGCVYVALSQLTDDLGDKSALVYALVFLAVILVAPGGMYDVIGTLRSWAATALTARRQSETAPGMTAEMRETAGAATREPVAAPAGRGES